jgi:hypothetical protein
VLFFIKGNLAESYTPPVNQGVKEILMPLPALKNSQVNPGNDGQAGFAVVITPANQDGRCPWAAVEDVRFTNNIVRRPNGNPMTVTLNGVSAVTFRYSIPAGGSLLLAPCIPTGNLLSKKTLAAFLPKPTRRDRHVRTLCVQHFVRNSYRGNDASFITGSVMDTDPNSQSLAANGTATAGSKDYTA